MSMTGKNKKRREDIVEDTRGSGGGLVWIGGATVGEVWRMFETWWRVKQSRILKGHVHTCNCCVETVERKGLGPEMSEGGEGGEGRGGAEQFDSRAL